MSVLSIDPDSFDYLLIHFDQHYEVKIGLGRRGRPPNFLDTHTVLGCLLHFYTVAVEHETLCELFGVPPTTPGRVLRNAKIALGVCLKTLSDAAICFPSRQHQLEWVDKTHAKETLV